jgi:hydroxymethylpyrimidine/phosphomethylpyrimidine kinase
MSQGMQPPIALTIAGSDSGGGAGIQADLKTFAMHCVHGACALTCVTAQNTLGVTRVDPLAPAAVLAQIDAVAIDLGIAAAKTGMLLNRDIISAVVDRLTSDPLPALVVDPVMVSRTGAQLIDDDAVALMRDRLLPLATVATPNCYEAQLLTGQAIESLADLIAAAKTIWQLGPQAVVVKGGGLPGELRGVDVWFAGDEPVVLRTETVDTPHTHGTGCSLSAAIAANLALGQAPLAATQAAKTYVTQALRHSLAIGQGQGPIGHFFPLLNG